MRKKGSLTKLILVLMLLAAIIFGTFYLYHRIKTARIIESTTSGKYWQNRYASFKAQPDMSNEIVFLGNSLTEGFDLTVFNDPLIINRGISGDFTEGVLLRLKEVTARNPSKIFLMIGINDIIEKVPLSTMCENYEMIIERIKAESPGTKLYTQSALPVRLRTSGATGDAVRVYTESFLTKNKDINEKVKVYNECLEELSQKYNLTYIDLHSRFMGSGGLKPGYTYDGVHLTREAYRVWYEQVLPYVKE